MLALDEIKGLGSSRVSPAISIFLPTHPESREIRQDPTRLKNLAEEAIQRLIERGCRAVVARALLRPAFALVADAEFWRHGSEGVALFLGPGFYRCHRVPVGLGEALAVNKHFSIVPTGRPRT